MTPFLQLLQVAIGIRSELSRLLTDEEWFDILHQASRQGIAGVLFDGVEQLPKHQMPCLDVIMDWSAIVDRIENDSRNLNAYTSKVCAIFKAEGKRTCVLKGQGAALLYPHPLRRMSGDIDVWMDGSRDEVIDYVRTNLKNVSDPHAHHIVATLKGGVEMEVHFKPAMMYYLKADGILNEWFCEKSPQQWNNVRQMVEDGGEVRVPTREFNLVFLLVHFFHHWAFEGCGLKQVLDYYYNLINNEYTVDESTDCQSAMAVLSDIGLSRFTAGMMWVMHEVFGVESEHLLCTPDEQLGRILLHDVLDTGVVGGADYISGQYANDSHLKKLSRRSRRLIRVCRLAPKELIWCFWQNIYWPVRWMLQKK